MKWQYLSSKTPQSLSAIKELLLTNRNIQESSVFFNPPAAEQIKPEEVGLKTADLQQATALMKKAVAEQRQIIVFGDYDADGICATAILWEALHQSEALVKPFIPHRQQHGYGLSVLALQELLSDNYASRNKKPLIITADNGIVAHDALKWAAQQGLTTIVTDHHQRDGKELQADAVVHTTQLSGAGVAWFLARAWPETQPTELLDLVSVATIADQVPLTDANRALVKQGLEVLSQTKRVGLRALLKTTGLKDQRLDSGSVGFGLAPRLNAMGRLAHGLDALRLLCTKNKQQASQLAQTLEDTNLKRQDLTAQLLADADVQAQQQSQESLLVVASPDYHEGVIGLLAGRLAEKYHKPAVALNLTKDLAKGSARSIPKVNVVALIREFKSQLLSVGGHPMAAGFSLKRSLVDEVVKRLQSRAKELIDPVDLQPSLKLDCRLEPSLVTTKLGSLIEDFAPFGAGNNKPLFGFEGVTLLQFEFLGKDKEHLKMMVGTPDDKSATKSVSALEVLVWRWQDKWINDRPEVGQKLKLAGQVELNRWNGRVKAQVTARSVLASLSS